MWNWEVTRGADFLLRLILSAEAEAVLAAASAGARYKLTMTWAIAGIDSASPVAQIRRKFIADSSAPAK
jgi:hypothetical protein